MTVAIDSFDDESEVNGANALQLRTITSKELAKHNTSQDLWISIQGKVYDVTEWVKFHPGGDLPLISLAGQDVTDSFLAFHPGETWHLLPKYLVGTLTDYSVTPLAAEHRKLLGDLKKAGLFKVPVHTYCFIMIAMLVLLLFCIFGVVFSSNVWVHVACAISLGTVWSQAGWIGHDTGHCGMLGNYKIDTSIGILVGNCLAGIDIGWWKRNHNAHHFSCNSVEYDPDLQYIPLFAVSSKFFSSLHSYFYERTMQFDGLARTLVSYQHWTFYFVMAVARINLYCQTVLFLLSKKRISNRVLQIMALGFYWTWFLSLLSYLPLTWERLLFVIISFAVTGIQHVQFCLNHFSSPVYQGQPVSKEWFQAQVRGTLNISSPSWMDWFHGGLQFQIEHHLFPRLPRHNLRKISKVVRPLCEKYDLPYKSVSFWEANVMIISTLRSSALQARDLSKPAPKNLLWEAVNAIG